MVTHKSITNLWIDSYTIRGKLTRMKSDYQTMKVWKSSLKKLRLICALSGLTMVQVIDNMLTEKLAELQAG